MFVPTHVCRELGLKTIFEYPETCEVQYGYFDEIRQCVDGVWNMKYCTFLDFEHNRMNPKVPYMCGYYALNMNRNKFYVMSYPRFVHKEVSDVDNIAITLEQKRSSPYHGRPITIGINTTSANDLKSMVVLIINQVITRGDIHLPKIMIEYVYN